MRRTIYRWKSLFVVSALTTSLWLSVVPLALGTLGASEASATPQSWRSNRLSTSREKNGRETRTLFSPVVEKQRDSIVRFLSGSGRELTLGTVIKEDGWVLTKASAILGFDSCLLPDGRRVAGRVFGLSDEHDLALVKLEADGLRPIEWQTEQPVVGQWLITPDGRGNVPVGLGVLSVPARRIPARRAVMGIYLEEEAPLVTGVLADSGAKHAGLRVGDRIRSIDGRSVQSSNALRAQISDYRVGKRVLVEVLRESRVFELDIPLTPADRTPDGELLGGDLSYVRSGFPLALQHDTPLDPRQCGGPLLDSDGMARAINIARSSRTASYAIPAAEIQRILPALFDGRLAPGSLTSVKDQERSGSL